MHVEKYKGLSFKHIVFVSCCSKSTVVCLLDYNAANVYPLKSWRWKHKSFPVVIMTTRCEEQPSPEIKKINLISLFPKRIKSYFQIIFQIICQCWQCWNLLFCLFALITPFTNPVRRKVGQNKVLVQCKVSVTSQQKSPHFTLLYNP